VIGIPSDRSPVGDCDRDLERDSERERVEAGRIVMGTAVLIISCPSSCTSGISSSYSSDIDPLLLLPISLILCSEKGTYLTSTNSSSPASLLYSGNVLTLLPLSVRLNARPLDLLPRLPLLTEVVVVAAVVLFLCLLLEEPVPARSSAVKESKEVAWIPSPLRSCLLRFHLRIWYWLISVQILVDNEESLT